MKLILAKALLVLAFMPAVNVAIAQPASLDELNQHVYGQEIMLEEYVHLMARQYGVSAFQMKVTIECESGWQVDVVNDQEQHSDGYHSSYGLGQFHPKTFAWFADEAGIYIPDIWNPLHQIEAMAWAFANGKQRHWTCWRNNFDT